jgi:lauroyl/myristoyl acyltransferase
MQVMPVRVAYRLAHWGTPVALLFARGHFERATANMQQVLGPGCSPLEARRLARDSFVNYARYMVDLLRLSHLEPAEILGKLDVCGWEHVEEAYSYGRGVVFVTGHIGNWDMAGAAFVARGRGVNVLVETLSPPRWNERVQHIRERVGMKAIPIETGVREMLAALRRKEGLAILVDRPVAEDGVSVTFFGRETKVPGGAATLAVRTGAPVVPAILVRNGQDSGYIAHIGPPILREATGSVPDDVAVLSQCVMSWLEDMIRRYPDQWYMFRSMWPSATASAS